MSIVVSRYNNNRPKCIKNNKLILQAKIIDTLCDAVVAKATELNTSQVMLECATTIQAKFKQAFKAFAKCHDVYDSSGLLEPPVIQQLRKFTIIKNSFNT